MLYLFSVSLRARIIVNVSIRFIVSVSLTLSPRVKNTVNDIVFPPTRPLWAELV